MSQELRVGDVKLYVVPENPVSFFNIEHGKDVQGNQYLVEIIDINFTHEIPYVTVRNVNPLSSSFEVVQDVYLSDICDLTDDDDVYS